MQAMTRMAGRRVKVIFNRGAGRGRAARWEERTCKAFRDSGVAFDLEVTARPGAAREIAARARREGFAVMVAAGGDGTVNEILNGWIDAAGPDRTVGPLVILPLGSGNDLAAAVHSHRSPEEAAAAIREGELLTLDVGHVSVHAGGTEGSRFFLNSVGAGFGARVNIEISSIRRGRGFILYLLGVIRALRRHEQPRLRVRWVDGNGDAGELEERCFLVSAGNGPRVGGGFYLTPAARYDDGLLDLCIVAAIGRLTVVRLLPKVLRGVRVTHPRVRTVRCRSFEITSGETFPVETDGEILATRASRVQVEVSAVRATILRDARCRDPAPGRG